jgi:hypothetical protein
MIKKHKATENEKRRDKEAKVYRYMADGYSQHDAELLAQAEIELEDGEKLDTK